MPVLLGSLWGAFLAIIGSIVGRVFLALGMAVITYVGFGAVIDELASFGKVSLTGMPDEIKKILGLLRVGEAFSMVASTVTIKMIYNGMQGGRTRRIGFK